MKTPSRSQGPVRGILVFLSSLFVISAILRVSFGSAIAQQAPLQSALTPPVTEAPQQCEQSPAQTVEILRQREARAATKDMAIADRMAALALVEAALSKRIEELEAAEAAIAETLSRADGAAEQDLTRLTAVYEAMKPQEAAALFETMAPEFASGFLGRMRPDAAAAVLSGMGPEAAYKLSLLWASRNALVPKE